MSTSHHPVESATRTCCGGIGSHTRDCASTLADLTDAELVAEVRRRTIGMIHQLGGLQLIRVYEAIKEIAPDVVK